MNAICILHHNFSVIKHILGRNMELSIFLAKLIGLYFLIVAIIFTFRSQVIKESLVEMSHSKGLITFSGAFALLTGLAIVIGHPVYEWSWRVLITLLGYLAIFQGIVRLAFANEVEIFISKVVDQYFWTATVVLYLLGLYLCYAGFFLSRFYSS